MALVLGTNCGFVTTAPTSDPTALETQIDNFARVTKDISPAAAVKITEIGWYCSNATQESNFEVGLYAADGAVVPGEAGTLLEVARTNAKGTGAGWKTVTVDWTISPSTSYWLGVQLDNTATNTLIDVATTGGLGWDVVTVSTLPNPFGGGVFTENFIVAIYAVWEAASGTNMQVNIGDVWKEVPLMKINIGDVWKDVAGAQINIGDAWKTIF